MVDERLEIALLHKNDRRMPDGNVGQFLSLIVGRWPDQLEELNETKNGCGAGWKRRRRRRVYDGDTVVGCLPEIL